MPIISELQVNRFRNLTSVTITPSPQFNIIYGENGAGKTSLLESIYYLGFGLSFRTHQAQRIIQHSADNFSVFTYLLEEEDKIPAGIERTRSGERKIKIDGESVTTLSPLAKRLPLQLMSTVSYRFFFNGPKIRRQYLDWMLFHVEQSFYPAWQSFQKVLKQRNAGLKAGLPHDQLESWNTEFAALANEIDTLRLNTIALFKPIFFRLLEQLLPEHELSLVYSRGWKENASLLTLLASEFYRDLRLGFTQQGPQRADLRVFVDSTPAEDVLSQGQQKMVLYAFHLALGLLLKQEKGISPIYLIDDLASELDQNKRSCVINVLEQLNAQVFVTGVDPLDLAGAGEHSTVFHVEHGTVSSRA